MTREDRLGLKEGDFGKQGLGFGLDFWFQWFRGGG